jgi:hypothetical protein
MAAALALRRASAGGAAAPLTAARRAARAPPPPAAAAGAPPPWHCRRAAAARALAFDAAPPGAPGPRGAGSGSSSGAGSCDAAASDAGGGCECGCGVLGWNTNFDGPGGRFTLGREVGRGSYGVVHAAVHRESGREYAVKVLSKCRGSPRCSSGSGGGGSPAGSGSPGVSGGMGSPVTLTVGEWSGSGAGNGSAGGAGAHLEAIEREVGAWMAAQGSRYVARLEGLYEDEERAYLVQELVGGGTTLKALLDARGGRLREAEAASVMRGVLDVLCECHRRDIVYGDVKVGRRPAEGGAWGPAGGVVQGWSRGLPGSVPWLTRCGARPFPLPPPPARQLPGAGGGRRRQRQRQRQQRRRGGRQQQQRQRRRPRHQQRQRPCRRQRCGARRCFRQWRCEQQRRQQQRAQQQWQRQRQQRRRRQHARRARRRLWVQPPGAPHQALRLAALHGPRDGAPALWHRDRRVGRRRHGGLRRGTARATAPPLCRRRRLPAPRLHIAAC